MSSLRTNLEGVDKQTVQDSNLEAVDDDWEPIAILEPSKNPTLIFRTVQDTRNKLGEEDDCKRNECVLRTLWVGKKSADRKSNEQGYEG